MFIDPVAEQIQASQELGADIVELHTGEYANADENPSAIRTKIELLQQRS